MCESSGGEYSETCLNVNLKVVRHCSAISYMVLFLNFRSYDNCYITEHFVKYNKKRQNDGKESLFPLQPSERNQYVKPSSLFHWTEWELFNWSQLLFPDVCLFFYVGTLYLLDFIMHKCCISTREWTFKIANGVMSNPGVLIKSRLPYIQKYLDNNEQLLADFEALKGQVIACAPQDVQPEYSIYYRCLVYGPVLAFTAVLEQYLHRLCSVICSALFPHMVPQRTEYLYNSIQYKRVWIK